MAGWTYSSSGSMTPQDTSRRFSAGTQISGTPSGAATRNMRTSGYSDEGTYTWATPYTKASSMGSTGGSGLNLGSASTTIGFGYDPNQDRRAIAASQQASSRRPIASGAFYSSPSSTLAGYADVSRQRAVDRAASESREQQQSYLDAAARRSAAMGKKFAYSPSAMVQAAANTAAAMTRAGDTASDQAYQRQLGLAGMRQGENQFTEANRRFPIEFGERQYQFDVGTGLQQQQLGLQGRQLSQQQSQFDTALNAQQQADINAYNAYQQRQNDESAFKKQLLDLYNRSVGGGANNTSRRENQLQYPASQYA